MNHISSQCKISKRIVEFHLSNIDQKPGTNSRTKTALWVKENQIS
ncbi:MAG: hypothetical protein JEZ06_14930 [Anaerolineaceae bacterium]|nr:hypothetical protein [Anaerolineaceae bacterium]